MVNAGPKAIINVWSNMGPDGQEWEFGYWSVKEQRYILATMADDFVRALSDLMQRDPALDGSGAT